MGMPGTSHRGKQPFPCGAHGQAAGAARGSILREVGEKVLPLPQVRRWAPLLAHKKKSPPWGTAQSEADY